MPGDPDGDEWVITGHKRWCGNAEAADFIQVLVRTRDPQDAEPRSAGLETLLVEKHRGGFPDGLTGDADRQDRLPRLPHLAPCLRRCAPGFGDVVTTGRSDASGFTASSTGSTSPGCTRRLVRLAWPRPP